MVTNTYKPGQQTDLREWGGGWRPKNPIPFGSPEPAEKYSPDQLRDDHGRWTDGGGVPGDAERLSDAAIAERKGAFAASHGAEVAAETDRLAADWYTMRPTSHVDDYIKGTLPEGSEKAAWAAVEADTQARLASEVSGDRVDLYRGIPGAEVVTAVASARASGAEYVVIPIHDSQGKIHEAVSATGQHELAARYAASRWERHGGDPSQAHTGIVMHLSVAKSDVVFSTAHSAFTNPYTRNWNEYVVRTGGSASLRLPMSQVEIVGVVGKRLGSDAPGAEVLLPVALPVRMHPAEATPEPEGVEKYSPDQPRDERGRWTDSFSSGDPAAEQAARDISQSLADDASMTFAQPPGAPIPIVNPVGAAFVSPSVTDKTFAEAQKAMEQSERQQLFEQASQDIDQRLGLEGAHESAVGAWTDGAENSTVLTTQGADYEAMRLSAAMKGSLADQKAVLVFQSEIGGPHTMWVGEARGSLGDIHSALLASGVDNHTLTPIPGGARIYVADLDNHLASSLSTYHMASGVSFDRYSGHGEFIGATHYEGTSDAEQRAEGRSAYEAVISSSRFAGPSGSTARAIWAGVRDRWSAPLRAAKAVFGRLLNKRAFGRALSAERPRIDAIRKRLAATVAHVLHVAGISVATQVRERLQARGLAKANDFIFTPEELDRLKFQGVDPELIEEAKKTGKIPPELWAALSDLIADDYADAVELATLDVAIAEAEKALKEVYEETGKEAVSAPPVVAQIGPDTAEELTNKVNIDAVDFAAHRAAELVGKRVLPDGSVVDNPDAKWAIDQGTRDRLRLVIAAGLASNDGLDAITQRIEQDFAFSPERADLIARTEISRANEQAKLDGWRDIASHGVRVRKSWLTVGDDRVDEDICGPNEDEGPIDLDEDFQSGDDAPPGHPNCRCVLILELDEGTDEGGDDDVEG